jgi:hypothetical protein
MQTIRQILLTEYIGAILVAVLIADAFSAVISTAVGEISFYLRVARHAIPPNVLRFSNTYSTLGALTRAALYLAAAYFIWRWLYSSGNPSTSPTVKEAE